MVGGNYRNSHPVLRGADRRGCPFSNEAKQVQLDLIYCYYKNGETESAIDAANQFERENPTHPRVDASRCADSPTFKGQSNLAC